MEQDYVDKQMEAKLQEIDSNSNIFDVGTVINVRDFIVEVAGMVDVADDYRVGATKEFNSIVLGYKLGGSKSEEEWNYLKGTYKNLLSVTNTSGSSTSNGANHVWNAKQNGESITITGSISAPTAYTGEFTASFGSATLTEGVTYKIEFDSTNDKTDMYMFSPAGKWCNVKQSTATTITENADGTYHYSMTFTAGLMPASADSTWPTTQSTDGSYTGTYTLRFDQDATEPGEERFYSITNARISVAKEGSYSTEVGYRGTPSHIIALDNNLKDVQYAVVDDGKLYLSRSYGSGAGNSVTFGFGETSKLTIADIDLSATPTKDVTISISPDNSITKTAKAHVVTEYENYPMMPMSEGLCIVNDLIFCTFEGASNKYMNESGDPDSILNTDIGNCQKPVDVIWKIDPYALENEVKTIDTPSTHYEKVNSLSEIEDGEEYLIVYESPVKDPVTQRNILYALDANGGYHDYRLSKSSLNNEAGYTGAIGHPITEYSFENGKLYLGNAEKDDVKNVRWEISKLDGNAYSIQSPDYYFINQPNFYCDDEKISMATDVVRGTNMKIHESGNGEGGFYISGGEYFLWCNDGTTASYNTAYNDYYTNSTLAMYSGVEEQPGTFHTDGTNVTNSNVLGGPVKTFDHGVFYIYKRVVDKTSSTYESRVYTDMKAELTSDGTYTINLETYAISPNHYQYVGERPTDYIIVMDASTSVTDNKDGTCIQHWPSNLTIDSLCPDQYTNNDRGVGVSGYAITNKDIYYKADDGNYYRIYLAVNTTRLKTDGIFGIGNYITQLYWAYYIDDDGMYNVLMSNNENGVGAAALKMTKAEFYAAVDSGDESKNSGVSSNTSNQSRQNTIIYIGDHYEFYDADDTDASAKTTTPFDTIKEKAAELVDEIAAQNTDNRIAVTYYGASANYLGTSGWASSGFTDAFWNASSNASNLKTQISSITSPGAQTDNSGMEFAFANNIMNNAGADYTADGDRNCVIIFMSDGVPGADSSSDPTTAANNVLAKSLEAKNNGAFVYSVVCGAYADSTTYSRRTFMDAVSSKYPAAESLEKVDGVYTKLGGANVDGVNYVSNLANCTIDGYLDFAPILGRELVKNDAVGVENLDLNSILYEELNNAFKPIIDKNGDLVDGIEITHQLVPGSYDKVERFTFDEKNAYTDPDVEVSWDKSNSHRITVSGYDYGDKYISKNRTGHKLRITITGVEADEEADITNTSINNPSTTAIYQKDGSDVFKYFPTEYFNIPTYTYVLDYDLPMYDKDINGTLCSVDGALNRQSSYKTVRETDNVALNFENSNLDMTYELVSTGYTDADNRSFCLIKRDDGSYDWFRINIVPASNVLFEENRFTASTDGGLLYSDWDTYTEGEETPETESYQKLSGEDDRYGYDEIYKNNGDDYSNGTVLKTKVNSSTKRSETMTFSYTGTGFDLMSVCGTNTGIQLVNIKKITTDESGNTIETIEKVYMVDTYYNDSAINGGDTLKQVPIVSHTNVGGYGSYTVEVTAAYLSTAQGVTGGRTSMFNKPYTAQNFLRDMDINIPLNEVEYVWYNDNSILNGGKGPAAEATASNRATAAAADVELDCYIDGIRVYNPLGSDSSLYIDSEKSASYYNVVNELAKPKGGVITGESDGLFAYVVGELEADDEGNIPTLKFDNYESVGPENEIYLQPATDADNSHAVAFNVSLPNDNSRVMISLRAVNGATTVKIASGSGEKAKATEYAINTATEQYYDITPDLVVDPDTRVANVIITNNGTGLLSVNNIKLVYASAQVVSGEDLNAMAMTFAMTPTRVEPNSFDYNAIVNSGSTQPDVDNPEVDEPVVDEPVIDNPSDDNTGDDVSVVKNFLDRIIAFFRKIFETIFRI